MARSLLYLISCIAVSLPLRTTCVDYQELGTFSVAFPAFSSLVQSPQSSDVYDLLLSSFSVVPGSIDHVWGVHDVGRTINEPDKIQPTLISDAFVWPNEVSLVPETVFAESGVVCVSSGRFPPKNNGSVALIPGWPGNVGNPVVISSAPSQELWSYTGAAQWIDMNGDGRLDAVVARFSFVIVPPNPPTFQGQLVWFEQPASGGLQTPNWTAHVLIQGPEFRSVAVRLPVGGVEKLAILCPEYFGGKLQVVWTEDPGDEWTDTTLIRTAIIDDDGERYFDVQVTDVNADGKDELLVVTSSETNGTVRVYEIPDDFRNGAWERHVIASGFSVPGPETQNKGTPGSPTLLKLTSAQKKPPILLSGDDDRHAYLLIPSADDPADWSYDKRPLLATTGIVGGVSAADVDGDGNIEAIIPAYGEDKVHVFRFTDVTNRSGVTDVINVSGVTDVTTVSGVTDVTTVSDVANGSDGVTVFISGPAGLFLVVLACALLY
ncbi:Hypp3039 [Branchiostoma lanceolatum]|uniref:Hypp3039 protein n=1 Tax=Branchiostoma lanceolatum TaxID=7740 RepID=A0A8J9ZZ51_BRALA|nr:Hypp3039 [Branchiostoma lanceolatum]